MFINWVEANNNRFGGPWPASRLARPRILFARFPGAIVKGAERERVNLRNARFREAAGPIDPDCGCEVCARFSAGYIHHLLRAQELLAITLLSIHNVFTMNRLMTDIRAAIGVGGLAACRDAWIP